MVCLALALLLLAGCLAGCAAKTATESAAASTAASAATSASASAAKSSETAASSTAAGSAAASASGSVNTELSGEVHYSFWGDSGSAFNDAMVVEFNKIYPNVKVYIEPCTNDEYWTKLEAAATGGSAADVFRMNGPNIVKYVNAGIIEPLDSYIEKDNVDLANYPSAMINLYNVNGKQYGIPVDYDTIGVWYNKTLFDAAGVEYPKDGWTWDEFVETAKKLTKADGSVYGVNADPNSQCGYYNTILESGGYIISDDKKTSGYDTDGAAKGIQVWLDLIDQGLSPDLASFAETKADAQFYSGRLAMYFGGSWKLGYINKSDLADQIDVASLPSIDGNLTSVIHGCANVLNAKSQNKEAAWEWLKFLTGKEAQYALAESGTIIPCYKGAADIWVNSSPDKNLSVFLDEAENHSEPYPVSANTSAWNDLETTYMTKIWNREVTVKDGLSELAQKMNACLAEEP